MTVIRPNSVSGITSITAQANEINFFRSNGTLAGLQLNGVNFNTTTGVSTFNNLDVGGVLTYQDVTNVDSIGIITARSTIDAQGAINLADSIIHTGDTNTKIRFPSADNISFETGGTERLQITGSSVKTLNAEFLVEGDTKRLFLRDTRGTGNTARPGIWMQDSASSNQFFIGNGSSTDTDLEFRNITTGDLVFKTNNNTERLRINSYGQVGINTSVGGQLAIAMDSSNTNPLATGFIALSLKNTNTTDNTSVCMDFNNSVGGIVGRFGAQFKDTSDKDTDLYFATRADGGSLSERLRITSDGKVGINDSNPDNQLVVKPVSGHSTAKVTSGDETTSMVMQAIQGSEGRLGMNTNHPLAIYAGTSERLRIKSDGTVVFNNTINTIHTSSNDSKLVLFGGSNNSVSNGGVLSLHGITNSSGNYTDLSAGAGGYIQFRSGTSEKFRITAGGEVLCGVTSTGTDPTRNITLHAGSMMRVSNFYMGRVHGSGNNGNAAIVLHRLGQNVGFQMSGSMTFHSYTGSAYLSGCIVSRYNNDSISRDVSLQKADSGMNLQLVSGTISGVSGSYLAIKKNGGGTGVCYINGFFSGNIESHGGIREVSNANLTTTTIHGSGITGGNDSSSS